MQEPTHYRPQTAIPAVKTEQQARIVLGKLLEQAAEGRPPETGVTIAELLRQYMTVAELDRSTR